VSVIFAGKYSATNLPKGPRGSLFKQLLPGIAPLTAALEAVAASRRKTVSQVCPVRLLLLLMLLLLSTTHRMALQLLCVLLRDFCVALPLFKQLAACIAVCSMCESYNSCRSRSCRWVKVASRCFARLSQRNADPALHCCTKVRAPVLSTSGTA
jgi:hypothetical protein